MAALAICESLMLALIETKILTLSEVCALLDDAAAAQGDDPDAVELIDGIKRSAVAAEPFAR